ncbi:hypothetical protein [Erwinia tracheiphila]|nr:hypothetical protein [Erwinia tracheiphila]
MHTPSGSVPRRYSYYPLIAKNEWTQPVFIGCPAVRLLAVTK